MSRYDACADALVLFGASGDLARKMLYPALAGLEAAGALAGPVVGVALEDWDDEALRERAASALREVGGADPDATERLLARLAYVGGDLADPGTYERLAAVLGDAAAPLFYLALPPSLFGPVVHQLARACLVERGRVVVEKPFGHDLASARALTRELCEVLDERQLLRIDHFLGKEPVMDIAYLRFANTLLEPVWNAAHVAHVQLTMAEDFGVEDRGSFYDGVGALRDVVQNHLLQLLGVVAMEAPGAGPDAIRDRKAELFAAVGAADPGRCVRGQYEGYRQIEGVAPDSQTETYVALELAIDNERWAGVPFLIRAGKRLPLSQTEVRLTFRDPEAIDFGPGPPPEPNHLVTRIDPLPGARARLHAKAAGVEQFEPADFEVRFEESVDTDPQAYQRLVGDAIAGRSDLFVRADALEQTWRIVEPLLREPGAVEPYAPGSWGPAAAARLADQVGGWADPWLP